MYNYDDAVYKERYQYRIPSHLRINCLFYFRFSLASSLLPQGVWYVPPTACGCTVSITWNQKPLREIAAGDTRCAKSAQPRHFNDLFWRAGVPGAILAEISLTIGRYAQSWYSYKISREYWKHLYPCSHNAAETNGLWVLLRPTST